MKDFEIMLWGLIYDTKDIVYKFKINKNTDLCKFKDGRWVELYHYFLEKPYIWGTIESSVKDKIYNKNKNEYIKLFGSPEIKSFNHSQSILDFMNFSSEEMIKVYYDCSKVKIVSVQRFSNGEHEGEDGFVGVWYGVEVYSYDKNSYEKERFSLTVNSYGDGCFLNTSTATRRSMYYNLTKSIAQYIKEAIEDENKFWLYRRENQPCPFEIEMAEIYNKETLDVEAALISDKERGAL